MIHDVLVSLIWPGSEPVGPSEYRNGALVGSAVGRPFQTAFQEDLYPSIFDKAAALFHSLIANHPFHNGNKRTAVMALEHFLLANGYFLILGNNEMYALAKETAAYRERGLSHDDIFRHIRQTVEESVIRIRMLRPRVWAGFYKRTLKARRFIRRHELNREQP